MSMQIFKLEEIQIIEMARISPYCFKGLTFVCAQKVILLCE